MEHSNIQQMHGSFLVGLENQERITQERITEVRLGLV